MNIGEMIIKKRIVEEVKELQEKIMIEIDKTLDLLHEVQIGNKDIFEIYNHENITNNNINEIYIKLAKFAKKFRFTET